MTGKNDRPRQYEYLKDMSIEKLEEILKASDDLLPESEETFIDAVAEEIVRRERENRTGLIPDVNEAKREFMSIYLSPEREGLVLFPGEDEEDGTAASVVGPADTHKKRPLPFQGLAVAAVIILLVSTALPPALGYESFSAMIGHWNDTVFHFVLNSQEPEVSSDEPEKSYESLQDALDANGVTIALAPKIPTEFETVEVYTTYYPEYERTDYNAFYKVGDQNLSIHYIQRKEPVKTRSYEKDESLVKKHTVNDIEHYIYENNGRVSITWYVDAFECFIQADISRDTAINLIDSIYER